MARPKSLSTMALHNFVGNENHWSITTGEHSNEQKNNATTAPTHKKKNAEKAMSIIGTRWKSIVLCGYSWSSLLFFHFYQSPSIHCVLSNFVVCCSLSVLLALSFFYPFHVSFFSIYLLFKENIFACQTICGYCHRRCISIRLFTLPLWVRFNG